MERGSLWEPQLVATTANKGMLSITSKPGRGSQSADETPACPHALTVAMEAEGPAELYLYSDFLINVLLYATKLVKICYMSQKTNTDLYTKKGKFYYTNNISINQTAQKYDSSNGNLYRDDRR